MNVGRYALPTCLTLFPLFTASCVVQQPEASALAEQPPTPVVTPPGETTEPIISKYKKSPDCEGPEYKKFFDDVNNDLSKTSNMPPELSNLTASLRQAEARSIIELAQYAEDKKCFHTARKTYLSVIDMFTGEAYASVRQRAQIGIDDLRASQANSNNKNGIN